MNNNFYNAVNKPLAHELRHNMTKAEACLWKYALKDRKMKGYSHFLDEVVEKDHFKDEQLSNAGFHILRFADNMVLKDISNIIDEIKKYIEDIEEKRISSPPPAPSKGGHRTAQGLHQ